eukprot:TRINITY_DN1495_c0_g1_i2.p1 TRINITY_DN1495_c0_g1~~TRINITY_DN1495_c0_g1_i2.p1  ORF type:complete len:340 (-),score=51.61 TRINITY_DN1495_c0_g1_i2:523-1542(-)
MDSLLWEERNIKQWKMKKLVQFLQQVRGNGTSLISLIIPPKDGIPRYKKMLADEFGTFCSIKRRYGRLTILASITSTQQKLKLYNRIPDNGLVIYCGTILTDEGKEKKISIDFEPHAPVNISLYVCDNKFHTEPLIELLESEEKFGFIVIDGNGTLFGTLSGNTRTVIHKLTVNLPNKLERGIQSAFYFSRSRLEKRHNYLKNVAELAVQFFITSDKPNVSGLILAGLSDFKTELGQSDMFDARLQRIITKIVDVSYGGENGFNQAIDLSADSLRNVKFVQEKKLISELFEEIAIDSGKYCFGIRDTMNALESGALDTLIVWDSLDLNRVHLRNNTTGG